MKNEQSLKMHNFLYLLCLYILDISDIFRHFQTISDIFKHFQTVFRDLKKNSFSRVYTMSKIALS